MAGLFLVFGGAAHYGALVLGWKRQREFVDRYIRQARRAAWGDELGVRGFGGLDSIGGATAPVPAQNQTPPATDGEQGAVAMNRRQKRMMDKENRKESKKAPKSTPRASGTSTPTEGGGAAGPATSTGERKRVVAENGKVLIVDSIGNVFLEEENEEGEKQEFLLDIEEIHRPAITDTLVFKLPIWCFQKTVGRITGSNSGNEIEEEEIDADAEVEVEAETTARSNSNRGASRRRGKRSQR